MKQCFSFLFWTYGKIEKNESIENTSFETNEGEQILLHEQVSDYLIADQIEIKASIKEKECLEIGEETNETEQIVFQQQFPDDIIAHQILTKLPIKDVIRFKSVSKQWCSTLSSSEFSHLYAKMSHFSQPTPYTSFLIIKKGNNCYLFCHDDNDDDGYITNRKIRENYSLFKMCNSKNLFKLSICFDEKLELVGSCNGLVCLASCFDCSFILWNPITGQVQQYEDHGLEVYIFRPSEIAWGFGYVSEIDDFKVVRIIQFAKMIWVHVFSLRSNKWTRIAPKFYQDVFLLRSSVFERTNETIDLMKGVLVHKNLYWIVHNAMGRGRRVISFDLVFEEFNTITDLKLESFGGAFLCEMGGCLCICKPNMWDDVNIEILKNDRKQESIFLSGDLCWSESEDLVGFTKTGKFFVHIGNSVLEVVDPRLRPMKCVRHIIFEGSGKVSIRGYVPALTYLPP